MKEFSEINPDLGDAMKSHLITDIDSFGIWDDDYDKFFNERGKAVCSEIEKRLIKQEIDRKSQPDVSDDYEEDVSVYE